MPLYAWIGIAVSTVLFILWLGYLGICIRDYPGNSNYGGGYIALVMLLFIALAPGGGCVLSADYEREQARIISHQHIQP